MEPVCLGAPDDALLAAARVRGWTLVSYDQDSIGALLKAWGEAGMDHGGIIFIDDRTLAPSNFGGLIRALIQLWDRLHEGDWVNRVIYLAR